MINLLIDFMERIERLWDALLYYIDADEGDTLKGGLSISITTEDAFEEPFIKELNVKFKYIDREELKRYNDEQRTAKEG